MAGRPIVVFGGTGFLGARIVDALLQAGHAVRVAARRPERMRPRTAGDGDAQAVPADVRDEDSVLAALAGAAGAVNAVGLYVERGGATFDAVHVEGASRVAVRAREAGARRLVHISGIGADPASPSRFVRARGLGESAVREGFGAATILRPSVMMGPGDSFLSRLIGLCRHAPAVPLFGGGGVRLQPVSVDDVAQAAARAVTAERVLAGIYELGGPEVYSYRGLLQAVADIVGRRPPLVPVPYALWEGLARAAALLPKPPLTTDQVALMRDDKVAAPERDGLAALAVPATPLREVVPRMLAA